MPNDNIDSRVVNSISTLTTENSNGPLPDETSPEEAKQEPAKRSRSRARKE